MSVALGARKKTACLIAVLAALVAAASAQSASAATLRIAYTASPQNVGIFAAQEWGIYKKYGIDAKLTPGVATAEQLPSLGKQYDIMTVTVTDVVAFRAKRGDLRILASSVVETKQKNTQNLVVEKGINSLKQLKGKTICSITVGNGQQFVAGSIALEKAGLNPKKDVKWIEVPFPNMLDSLRAGRCDAALTTNPYINQMKAAGYGTLANTLLSVAPQAPSALFGTASKLVKKDPKTYRNFVKAYRETIARCQADTNECAQVITKVLGTNINAARSTPFDQMRPKPQDKWFRDWIKPMERYGFIKKGRLTKKTKFVINP